MRLVTFSYEGNHRIGALMDQRVIDLNYACEEMLKAQGQLRAKPIADAYVPANMVDFLQGGEQSLTMAKEGVDFAIHSGISFSRKVVLSILNVRLEAPVQNPAKMICVGHNYREHILEMGREIPPYPVIFAKFANTIIGPQDDISLYPISDQLDYEAEFAFVIGKQARNVAQQNALDYVAGYTIVNDVTYRDLQRRTIEWLQGKTVEGSAPMGPWLVTKDEITNPAGLEVVLTVNGEERQRSNTKNLVFTVPYLVKFLSGIMTLEPGDVVLTGTPGGVGVARDPQVFLREGDVVRIEIDQLGVLMNQVKKVEEGESR
jgi:acylpyruvate hydrolase